MPQPNALHTAPLPSVETARLVLRPFEVSDEPDVERCLSDEEVTRTTLTIPHPYPTGEARQFIERQHEGWAKGKRATWAMIDRASGALVGAVGLQIAAAHRRAEVGYWVAREAWGQGIATEATAAVIAFAFDRLGLNRVEAHHFMENPASGAVMRKCGMQREGLHRQVVWRGDTPKDLVSYAILRSDPRPGAA